jgi:RNase P subunit RPR2
MDKMSKVRLVSIATPEWHWYCPNCERPNMSRIQDFDSELGEMRVVTCSECGEKYEVKNDRCNHNKQPKVIRR